MELVIILAIGIVVGSIITRIIIRPLDIGTLRIDTSDPDGPFMFLELSKDVDTVASKKYVILKVNLKNYISQK
ncbi:beta-lactamase induction signal transducer protein [uncultured Bacteroides sp.]|uniref:beta-lactamase induction signal transducer protein n=1 Tax=uncultured Bacteroides sp. TaxID=162156 RepID=UPI0024306490|nr:beta-lactamase induction signal transducer protein [Bacteroides acidifaciens]